MKIGSNHPLAWEQNPVSVRMRQRTSQGYGLCASLRAGPNSVRTSLRARAQNETETDLSSCTGSSPHTDRYARLPAGHPARREATSHAVDRRSRRMADLSTPAESPVAGLSIAPFFSGIDVQQHAQSWCGFVSFDQDLAGGVWAPTRAPSGGLRARSAHQKRPSLEAKPPP